MKIEFGCGETPTKENFKTCDIRNVPGVDFVCTAWDIDKQVNPNSVDEIFSRHFFEHLTFPQGERVLEVWYKILRPGGICEMMLPNMNFHIDQWVNQRDNPKKFKHAKAGFWGWQREGDTEFWDVHKSGYDFDSLKDLLQEKGFINIQELNTHGPQHLHISCIKNHI